MNILHVFGVFYRNILLIKRSVPKLFGLFGFITFEMFLWGFVTFWLSDLVPDRPEVDFVVLILSALIFWHLFIRSQQSFSISFLEDVWSRNVINLFAAPVKLKELIAGFALVSIAQGLLAFFYITSVAFVIYALNIWDLGLYIIPFFLNILVFGWALGLVTIGLIIRFGPSADILAFFIPFFLLPFSAVYYPISVFPPFLQTLTLALPTRHMFEGMRLAMTEGTVPTESIVWAGALNIVYFVLGFLFFYWMLSYARKKGFIARLVNA